MYVVKNNVALISGASSGIGQAAALALAKAGSHLALLARRLDKLEQIAMQCREFGVKVLPIACDVVDKENVAKAVEKVIMNFNQLNMVIVNQGIYYGEVLESVDLNKWHEVIEVNLLASMSLAHYCLPHVIATRKKFPQSTAGFVFTGSIAALSNSSRSEAYCASKSGLLSFAHCLFEDVREYGIKVSTLNPGMVNTPLLHKAKNINPNKTIQPEDVAQAILYVFTSPETICPVELTLRPQYSPYLVK